MALLDDIIGFVGEQFRQQNEQRQKAFEQVRKGGKLPEGLMSSVMGAAPMGGMISPLNWKMTGPEEKALVSMVGNKFPEFFSKVLKAPRDLVSMITDINKGAMTDLPFGMTALGDFKNVGPDLARIRIDPFKPAEAASRVPIMAHEMQHYLNAPKLNVTGDAAQGLAEKIFNVLPKGGRGSLSTRLGQLGVLDSGAVPQELQQLHSNLGGDTGKLKGLLQKAAFDEGLAHLTEHTARPGVTPEIKNMAKQFGIGVDEPNPLLKSVMNWPEEMSRGGFKPVE